MVAMKENAHASPEVGTTVAAARLSLARLAVRVYVFPAVMAIIAIMPGLNFLYSGHGGPAWLLLPFAFPVTLAKPIMAVRAADAAERPRVRRFVVQSLGAYALVSFGVAHAAAASVRFSFGLDVNPMTFWALFLSPFGLVAFL
jgi:hypothetical protein